MVANNFTEGFGVCHRSALWRRSSVCLVGFMELFNVGFMRDTDDRDKS